MYILWLKNLRDIEQGKRSLGAHELNQEKRNLPAVEAIKYNNCPCLEIHDL